jgi:hypothetical protein
MSIYEENGYCDRKDYLECLAAEYGVPLHKVWALAKFLGPEEDFDGLVSEVIDLEDLGEF